MEAGLFIMLPNNNSFTNYLYLVVKVSVCGRGQPEGSFFNSSYSEV